MNVAADVSPLHLAQSESRLTSAATIEQFSAESLVRNPSPWSRERTWVRAQPFVLYGADSRPLRLEHGYEDQDVRMVCSSCSKTVYLFEKDRYSIRERKNW